MEYRFLPLAEAELQMQVLRYGQEARGLDREFFDEVERSITFVRRNPLASPELPPPFRSRPLAHFPFNIVYTVEPAFLLIVAVAHQRRKPDYWLGRIR